MTWKPLLPSLLAAVLFSTGPAFAAEPDLSDDLARFQGRWKATVTTDDGTSNWTLDIKGHKTRILIESKAGEVIFKGESDFKLEAHGKFKAYTYYNVKVLAGPDEGETRLTEGKTRSSIYRLSDDTLFTVGGLREDDTDKPRLIQWEKAGK